MWCNQKSELYFYWTVMVSFFITHIDIWFPLHVVTNKTVATGYLTNCMWDLIQFVISSINFDIISTNLAFLFVSKVILSFGMCSVVEVDGGSTFKKSFIQIFKALKRTYLVISKGNHKGNSCEKYQYFLKKHRQYIAMIEAPMAF